MGVDKIVNSESVVDSETDLSMFEINNNNYQKVGPNVLLASAIHDVALSIICREKPGLHSSGIVYDTIDKAIQYLDMEKEEFKTMGIIKLINPYLYTSFILKDNDISNKENIPKARLALTTLKQIIQNPPLEQYKREEITKLLNSYAEILESPRYHPEANHNIDLDELD